MTRLLAFATLCLALVLPALSPAAAETLVLEEYFKGKTSARGCFTTRIDGKARCLTVKLVGRWNGKTLTLVEDFFYDDGEVDRKTWRFTRTGRGTYRGTREDVIGPAEVTTDPSGNIRLRYTATVGGRDLFFDDTLALRDDGTVLNTAVVWWGVLPVADIELVFKRGH